MRPAERKTRVETLINENYVSGETLAIFVYLGFQTYDTKEAVRLDVEASQKCPCPAACASQWRLSRGDDTQAVGTRPMWAREHTLHT